MTWFDYHSQLSDFGEQLQNEGLASWEEISPLWEVLEEQFRKLDHLHQPDVVRAIRAFAKGESAPPLSREAKFFLWLRVNYAEEVALALHPGSQRKLLSLPNGSREEMLHWLLVETWEMAGFSATHGMIESLQDAWPRDSASGKN